VVNEDDNEHREPTIIETSLSELRRATKDTNASNTGTPVRVLSPAGMFIVSFMRLFLWGISWALLLI
jgi:hypothetical protein